MTLIQVQEPLVIQTRKGRAIPNDAGIKTRPQDVIQEDNYQKGEFPEGNQLRKRKNPTGLYNCHAMTFLSRRARLVEEHAVEMVLQDDDYFDVRPSDVEVGDVIFYYNAIGELEHTGVVMELNRSELGFKPRILSKWGNGGEFVHFYDYCPYNWRSVRYKREGRYD